MTETELKDLSSLFQEMKGGYERAAGEVAELRKRLDRQQSDADQFAATMREKMGAIAGAKAFGSGGTDSLVRLLQQSKALTERPHPSQTMSMSAAISTKDILGISTQLPAVDQTIHGGPRLELRFRSLMPTIPVSNSGGVEYVTESSFTNNAGMVAEGATKPKSDKTFVVNTLIFRTIAHYFKISRQCYTDLPQLVQALADNLVYGLALKLESQLIKGSNTGQELQGVYGIATPATALPPPDTGAPPNTLIDDLFAAAAEQTAKGFPPDGGAISAADWSTMQRLKDSTGRYILSDIPALPPLVVSSSLTAGEWVIGAFKQQSALYVREEAHVMTATQSEDDFIHNLICMLGEMRAGAVWYNPLAFTKNPAVTP